MSSSFTMPREIISGKHALESEAAKEIFRRSGKKALIITGPNLMKRGICSPLEDVLQEEKIDYVFYSDIPGEPDDQMVRAALEAYRKNECDFLIALGGGSPVDLMKAVGALTERNGNITDYMMKNIDWSVPTMIAIPTTAGTGSEATQFTIITDSQKEIKMLLKGTSLMPEYAIVDSRFTVTAPPSVTAATGLDALCHCVEAFTSRKAQPMSDTFALSAVKRIFAYLPVCFRDGENEEAREQMSLAALEAGIAFNNASVTLIHGMSRPIGALFHVPHGLSNAMLMEECLAYALSGAYDRFAALGRAIGAAGKDDDAQTASKKFMEKLISLKEELNIPTPEVYGIDREKYFASVEKMTRDAMDSGSPGNTIRNVQESDVLEIYKRVWNGR